jgi:hypothetical protein
VLREGACSDEAGLQLCCASKLRMFAASLSVACMGTQRCPPLCLCLAACAQVFVPRLLQQEKFIFDELVSYVWTHTFVPAVAASRARPANAALAAGVVKRSGQEAALRKWLAALEAVSSQLKGLGREGHSSTLRHQVRAAHAQHRAAALLPGLALATLVTEGSIWLLGRACSRGKHVWGATARCAAGWPAAGHIGAAHDATLQLARIIRQWYVCSHVQRGSPACVRVCSMRV